MPELPEVDPTQNLPRLVVFIHAAEGSLSGARNIKGGDLYSRTS